MTHCFQFDVVPERILARDWKAVSESFDKIFCFIEPTARWQRIICSSMGNLEAIVKK